MAFEVRYNVGEVAEMLGVSPSSVRKWTDSGRMACFRFPGSNRRMIPESEVLRYAREAGILPEGDEGDEYRDQ